MVLAFRLLSACSIPGTSAVLGELGQSQELWGICYQTGVSHS